MIEKVAIYDTGSGSHRDNVATAFLDAYPTYTGLFLKKQSTDLQEAFDLADMVIYSNTGLTGKIAVAKANYPKPLFVPAGSNSHISVYTGDIPIEICVTGAGDIANETGYKIELYSPDYITVEPDLSSYSNGFIAGVIAYLMNTKGWSYWQARVACWMTASNLKLKTDEEGYGLINKSEAENYESGFPEDPFLKTRVYWDDQCLITQ